MIKFSVTQEPFYEYGATEVLCALDEIDTSLFISYVIKNLIEEMVPKGTGLEKAMEEFHYAWLTRSETKHLYFKFMGKPFVLEIADGDIRLLCYSGVAKYSMMDLDGIRQHGILI